MKHKKHKSHSNLVKLISYIATYKWLYFKQQLKTSRILRNS